MRLVQFALKDAAKVTRLGLQQAEGHILDLSAALPTCSSLVDALAKLGAESLIEKVKR
jgi:hypothetical protein